MILGICLFESWLYCTTTICGPNTQPFWAPLSTSLILIYPFIHLPTHHPTHLLTHPSPNPPTHPFIHLPTFPTNHPSIYPFTHPTKSSSHGLQCLMASLEQIIFMNLYNLGVCNSIKINRQRMIIYEMNYSLSKPSKNSHLVEEIKR